MIVLCSSSSLVNSSTFNFPNNYNTQLRFNPKNRVFFASHRTFRPIEASISTANQESSLGSETDSKVPSSSMKLLFVEMGVGYDQHGQNVTSAAVRACKDAITSNSIPPFRRVERF